MQSEREQNKEEEKRKKEKRRRKKQRRKKEGGRHARGCKIVKNGDLQKSYKGRRRRANWKGKEVDK